MMSVHEIDLLFPYFVFVYGFTLTLVLHLPALVRLSEERLPEYLRTQMNAHRHLAFVCLVVGSLWSLQNLIID